MRAIFFNSEGAKINDSLGPPGVRPRGYALFMFKMVKKMKNSGLEIVAGLTPPLTTKKSGETITHLHTFSNPYYANNEFF